MRKDKKILIGVLVVLWGAGIAASVATLGDYEFTAGEQGDELARWPLKLPLAFEPGKLNLVAMVHPHCPCSKVSLSELEQALQAAPAKVAVKLVYYVPKGAEPEWTATELVENSRKLAAASLHFDADGKIAALMGARTSFDVFLFDKSGQVIFRGGITRGRGVSGVNMGRAALEAALSGKIAGKLFPVYGCPLQKNSKNPQKKV